MNTNPHTQSPGRRVVVTWLSAFVAIQVTLAVLLDGPLESLRNPDYVARRELLQSRQREQPGRPLVVVLGTSRTMNGLIAALLNDGRAGPDRPLVFNFGLPGHGPMHQAVAFERLLTDLATSYLGELLYGEPSAIELADPLVLIERTEKWQRPLPPFFITCGRADPILHDSQRLEQALTKAKVPHTAKYYLHEPHAFHAFVFRKRARQCWRDTYAFLDKHLPTKP